jgi:lysophospholipase L1-like esterase
MKNNKWLLILVLFCFSCTDSNDIEIVDRKIVDRKIKVVILGSSIASGAGATNYEYSWAGLLKFVSKDSVINNAVGGYTTFHFLPETKPNYKGIGIDVKRNITASLKLAPDLIIFSITTNDIANGFTVDDYITNMNLLTDACEAKHVPFLIGSTSPRPLDIEGKKALVEVNNRLKSIYRDRFVNYYYALTNLDTFEYKSIYNSGDNLHPNDAGHKVIFDTIYPTYLKMKDQILSKHIK